MIDVIIPAYNAHKTIDTPLESLSRQTISGMLNVYIVNDASDKDYKEYVEKYSDRLRIKEITLKKNGGPGIARQKGIEKSNSKYIMFIDSDDKLYADNSAELLYQSIEYNNVDLVTSKTLTEYPDGNEEKGENYIWVHGKVYRREFINKNNIKFNNTRSNEDNGFNQLYIMLRPTIFYLDEITYVWCYNEDSITRRNGFEFSFKGLDGYFYNMNWAIKEGLKRDCDMVRTIDLTYYTFYASYFYYMQYKDIDTENIILKNGKRLYEIVKKHPLPQERVVNIYQGEIELMRTQLDEATVNKPYMTIIEYIDKIKTL